MVARLYTYGSVVYIQHSLAEVVRLLVKSIRKHLLRECPLDHPHRTEGYLSYLRLCIHEHDVCLVEPTA